MDNNVIVHWRKVCIDIGRFYTQIEKLANFMLVENNGYLKYILIVLDIHQYIICCCLIRRYPIISKSESITTWRNERRRRFFLAQREATAWPYRGDTLKTFFGEANPPCGKKVGRGGMCCLRGQIWPYMGIPWKCGGEYMTTCSNKGRRGVLCWSMGYVRPQRGDSW